MSKPRILLVDDDPQSLESTRKILDLSGYTVITANDGEVALERVREARAMGGFDLILTDVRMPRLGGLEFLRALSVCGEAAPVVLMTAFGRVEDAVWAMKLGAVDFLTKPFKRMTLIAAVETALKRARALGGRGRGEELAGTGEAHTILGRSEAIRSLRALVEQVAPTLASVLLSGESGSGKELVARMIHAKSARASGPFVAINCAAVPEPLIESELFGHEKGAFTGASSAKPGLFESANGGTLLLDEIGDMPLSLQAKLLRVLQEGEVRRVGATVSRRTDVRVVAATHRGLRECVKAGTFRQDLLYRLEVVELAMPPLRDRAEDIPELVRHFLKLSSRRHGRQVNEVDPRAMELLMAHSWPGNVRELSNVIERAVVFVKGTLVRVEDLPTHVIELAGFAASRASSGGGGPTIAIPLGTTLKDVEDLLIRKTLEATSGDKNMTARLLGINSRTIYRKLGRESDGDPV